MLRFFCSFVGATLAVARRRFLHQFFSFPLTGIISDNRHGRAHCPRYRRGDSYACRAEVIDQNIREHNSARKLQYTRNSRGIHVTRAAQHVKVAAHNSRYNICHAYNGKVFTSYCNSLRRLGFIEKIPNSCRRKMTITAASTTHIHIRAARV